MTKHLLGIFKGPRLMEHTHATDAEEAKARCAEILNAEPDYDRCVFWPEDVSAGAERITFNREMVAQD